MLTLALGLTSERNHAERAWPLKRRNDAFASSGNTTPVRFSASSVSARVAPGLNTLAGDRAKRRRSCNGKDTRQMRRGLDYQTRNKVDEKTPFESAVAVLTQEAELIAQSGGI